VERVELPLNQIPEFSFEVKDDPKKGKCIFYTKMPMVIPHPLFTSIFGPFQLCT
jgi:hypothetical protein